MDKNLVYKGKKKTLQMLVFLFPLSWSSHWTVNEINEAWCATYMWNWSSWEATWCLIKALLHYAAAINHMTLKVSEHIRNDYKFWWFVIA